MTQSASEEVTDRPIRRVQRMEHGYKCLVADVGEMDFTHDQCEPDGDGFEVLVECTDSPDPAVPGKVRLEIWFDPATHHGNVRIIQPAQ